MIIEAGTLTDVISNNTEKKNVQMAAAGVDHTEKNNTEPTFFQKSVEAQNTMTQDMFYDKPKPQQGPATEEIQEAFGSLDAEQRKDQMAVLSNTTTASDYQQMQEDGFSPDDTDSRTIVTEMDKIKMNLAKAGKDISCYGDLPDKQELEAVLGSAGLVEHVESQMQQQDVPATEDNVQQIEDGARMAQSLTGLSDGAVKYMLDNQLPPTIENIYKAEYSGSTATDVTEAAEGDYTDLQQQINQVIQEAGLESTPSVQADASWMIQNDIPLTPENLAYVEELRQIPEPIDMEQAIDSMVGALADGKRAVDGVLTVSKSLIEQAQDAAEVLQNATDADLAAVIENDQELTIENLREAENQRQQNTGTVDQPAEQADTVKQTEMAADITMQTDIAQITARRQLEEARLYMTASASYTLLKQGIEIDTQPLEELVDQLKQMEEDYYSRILTQSGVEPSSENIAQLKETNSQVELLKMVPCYSLASEGIHQSDTITSLLERGQELQDTLERANQSYETMMTTPRKDLGDSITKAFRNVDAILEDLGLETSQANQRAVRILGYNSLAIDQDSITTMKAADQQVQMTFKNMTPAVVTEFIKRGIDPLDLDLGELNAQASAIREELGDTSAEKYSQYLYDLEKNDALTQEERQSYIGVFRLINQVEKNDGAAIGALVNQGAEITMRSLMTAIRSSKKENTEYTIDDSAGETEVVSKGTSITDQIEASYQTGCLTEAVDLLSPQNWKTVVNQAEWENLTPEQLQELLAKAQEESDQTGTEEYIQSQLEQLDQAAKAPEQIYQLLEHFDLPNTINNILAASNMLGKRSVFRKLFEETPDSEEIDMEELKEETLRQFSDALGTPEDMAEAQKTLADTAENVMKTMILSENVSTLDIRQMKLAASQLHIAEKMAREEQYAIPVMVGDELTNLTLKIVRGKEEKGKVDIMFETPSLGRVAAEISAAGKVLQGYIATNREETQELLSRNSQQLQESVGNGQETELSFLVSKELDLNTFGSQAGQNQDVHERTEQDQSAGTAGTDEAEESKRSEQHNVQTSTLYGIAERFIKVIKAIDLA